MSKNDLIDQAQNNVEKLWQLIESMADEALDTEFDFSGDSNKKEAHWARDKNLRDVLVHLYEWHQLLLCWINSNMSGNKASFLPEPYNWKTYGHMNVEFWEKHQSTELHIAKDMVKASHDDVLALVHTFTDDELFTKQFFDWTGTTTLGSYCASSMPSHYDWAMKKLRAHKRQIANRARL